MNSADCVVIEGCAIATMDDDLTEHSSGHIVIEAGAIVAVGEGNAPGIEAGARRIDGRGLLATPGLVNCHHHLYQWLTRGRAQQSNLFEWLTELYPVWAHIDVDMQRAAARAGLAALARSGCSTTTDHHYVFPRGAGDLLEAAIGSAQDLGLRFHPCRGSMDLGRTRGGLPPDEVTEDRDAILAATERAIDTWHDPAPGSMLRIAVAPCSPFSVTGELMQEAARLARARGVRLHTHLAETLDEQEFCVERFGVRPVEYLDDLDWLGSDVWLAHCVHLSDSEVHRLAESGTGVAHCPTSNARLGAGIAPVASLSSAGAAVGLGVDGAASNEAGELAPEIRQAMLVARIVGGPSALTARGALALATRGGARCLGRDEIGSLEPAMQADVALWRLNDLDHAGIEDPVTALVFGPPRPVELLLVKGRVVVEGGQLLTADESSIAAELDKASTRLLEKA
jgi:cytosine/adenosine deaminase-related metal-dependent hydrolase